MKRSDCIDGPRPCPHIRCRYHLAVERRDCPDLAEMPETCALDVADRGGCTLEEIAQVYGITREGVRLIEATALAHARPGIMWAGIVPGDWPHRDSIWADIEAEAPGYLGIDPADVKEVGVWNHKALWPLRRYDS